MKKIVFAVLATLFVTGCLFSKKDEGTTEEVPAATEEAAPAATEDANNAAPAAEPAPAE